MHLRVPKIAVSIVWWLHCALQVVSAGVEFQLDLFCNLWHLVGVTSHTTNFVHTMVEVCAREHVCEGRVHMDPTCTVPVSVRVHPRPSLPAIVCSRYWERW